MEPGSGAAAREPAAERARLYEEAVRLTEEFARAALGGDDSGAEEFSRNREAIFEAIDRLGGGEDAAPAASEAPDAAWQRSRAAIQRILELDRELMTCLEARKAGIQAALTALRKVREALHGYKGASRTAPSYVDRTA